MNIKVSPPSRATARQELRRGSLRQRENWLRMFQMPKGLTITPSSVEVTPLTRSAKILFRLLPGRYEMRKGLGFPDAP